MTPMLKRLLFVFLITALAVGSVSAQAYTGYFSIDSTSAEPGEQVAVPVYLHNNNVDFTTLYIPFRYDGDILSFDSVSYEGSIKPIDFSGADFNFGDRSILQITYIPPFGSTIPSISATDGLIGTIYFSVNQNATPGFYPVDSVSLDTTMGSIQGWIGAIMANSSGDTIWFPEVEEGGVTVKVPTGINDNQDGLPSDFALGQNYPNPFNPKTVISYSLAESGPTKLEVFNVLGQAAATLVDRVQPAGNHTVEFDASAYPSGIFFYRLTQGTHSSTKKMVLVK